MAAGSLTRAMSLLRASVASPDEDQELLSQFMAGNNNAFEVLVRRYGALVHAVCCRVLTDPNQADDAFQATFLVLARKARQVRRTASLAAWLYAVAYRSAQKLRCQNARRRTCELQAATVRSVVCDDSETRDLHVLLDEELMRMPARLREPLVLCYLSGRSRADAARQLGCSFATLKLRLHQGRRFLRSRLQLRQAALSTGLLLLANRAQARMLEPGLVDATVRAAGAGSASPVVRQLAEGVIMTMVFRETARKLCLPVMAGLLGMAGLLALTWSGVPTNVVGDVHAVPFPQEPEHDRDRRRWREFLAQQTLLARRFRDIEQATLRVSQRPEARTEFDDGRGLVLSRVSARFRTIMEQNAQIDSEFAALLDCLGKTMPPRLADVGKAREISQRLMGRLEKVQTAIAGQSRPVPAAPWDERLVKKLLQRAKDLVVEESWVEACDVLQRVLDAGAGELALGKVNSADIRQTMKDARAVLAAMPRNGKEIYELRYGPLARKLLDEAQAAENSWAVIAVYERFEQTSVGPKAADLLENHSIYRLTRDLVPIIEGQRRQQHRLEGLQTDMEGKPRAK